MRPTRILILGYGTLGRAFYRLHHDEYEIRGVRRNPQGADACPVYPMAIQSDWLRPHLEWADVILFCPSSGGADLPVYRDTYFGNMQYVIRMIRDHHILIQCFVLVGSTGVYPHDLEGTWLEETAIPIESPRQEVLRETEKALIESGLPYLILRCGGLYGKERGGFSRMTRKGQFRTDEMSGQFIGLVHQDDVGEIIHRLIRQKQSGEIYNIVDDSGLRRKTLYRLIADQAKIPIVETGPPPSEPDRWIPNAKLKKALGYEFRCAVTAHSLGAFLPPLGD